MENNAVKIVSLEEENFKRIKAFDFQFGEDGILEIVGDNAQGKSSVIDGLMAALCGGKAVPERPLKDGERKGKIKVELDNGLTVERTFTKSGSQLRVFAGQGTEQKSPQKLLDELYGLGFNVSQFLSDQKKQRAILLSVSEIAPDWMEWPESEKPSEFDVGDDALAWIDKRRAEIYASRTIANAAKDKAKGNYDTIRAEVPRGQEDKKPESAAALMAERDKARAHNEQLECDVRSYEMAKQNVKNIEDDILLLTARLERLRADLLAAGGCVATLEKSIAAAKPIGLAPINAKIAALDETNRVAAKCEQLKAATKELKAAEDAAEKLDYTIKDIDDFKTRLLASAKFPLDGLGVDADCVTWKGIPLSQASHSESLEVAVSIALALDPKLRLIILDDAEKFGDAALKRIITRLQENNFQGIIARVGSDTKTPHGVIIEEGEIVI